MAIAVKLNRMKLQEPIYFVFSSKSKASIMEPFKICLHNMNKIYCVILNGKDECFMSFPNIPKDISPDINLPADQIINLLLASIAFEELGLAHIINAEAEKVQSILGTLKGQTANNPTIGDLERIDKLVETILRDVIKEEMLLQFKLENILDFTSSSTTTTTTTKTTTSTTTTTTTTTKYDGPYSAA